MSRYNTPYVVVPHRHYPHPYFVFRPQYWVGFGLYAGYPLAYPVMWGYPTYIYDAGAIVALPALPPESLYGGISFAVVPDDAVVIVDGGTVGVACDFSPTEQPLTLRPGVHQVELRAPGMIPLAFDVLIVAGQVVPYSGVLQPR